MNIWGIFGLIVFATIWAEVIPILRWDDVWVIAGVFGSALFFLIGALMVVFLFHRQRKKPTT